VAARLPAARPPARWPPSRTTGGRQSCTDCSAGSSLSASSSSMSSMSGSRRCARTSLPRAMHLLGLKSCQTRRSTSRTQRQIAVQHGPRAWECLLREHRSPWTPAAVAETASSNAIASLGPTGRMGEVHALRSFHKRRCASRVLPQSGKAWAGGDVVITGLAREQHRTGDCGIRAGCSSRPARYPGRRRCLSDSPAVPGTHILCACGIGCARRCGSSRAGPSCLKRTVAGG
jgi:hypothetical protein